MRINVQEFIDVGNTDICNWIELANCLWITQLWGPHLTLGPQPSVTHWYSFHSQTVPTAPTFQVSFYFWGKCNSLYTHRQIQAYLQVQTNTTTNVAHTTWYLFWIVLPQCTILWWRVPHANTYSIQKLLQVQHNMWCRAPYANTSCCTYNIIFILEGTGITYCDVGCHTLIPISHSEAVPTDVPHSRLTALLPVPEIAKIDKHSNASHIRKHTMKHTYWNWHPDISWYVQVSFWQLI